jgi:cysteine-rich repeat protein
MRHHLLSRRPLLAVAGLFLMQAACEVRFIEGVDSPEESSGTGACVECCSSSTDCTTGGSAVGGSSAVGGASAGAVCGDGVVDPEWEQCDDGNTADGDACSSDCQLRAAGSAGAVCGDGVVEPPREQCDDGNTADGDGCTSDCQIGPA